MPNERTYTFVYNDNCNMCGSSLVHHKVLGKRLNRSQGKNPRNKIGITTTVMQCAACGLIYPNPLPVPMRLADHYGVPPEEYWKKEYFVNDEKYFINEINTLKSLYAFKPGDRALDIGAGLGKCMIALSRAGFEAFGVEPSAPFYERAVNKMGIRSDRLKLSSLEQADYPEEYFDFITFGAVLEHLYDPSESIKKAMRLLKRNRIMQIEVPSSRWLVCRIQNLYYRLRGLDYVSNLSPMHEPYHLYEFSLKAFQKHAGQNNYQILHHEYYVAETYLPKIFDFFLVPYMRYTNTGMQLCVWLKKL